MSLTSAFARLGIAPTASQLEVRKAYLRAALKAHPDKGGSNERFRSIVDAFEAIVASGANYLPSNPLSSEGPTHREDTNRADLRYNRCGAKRTRQQTSSCAQTPESTSDRCTSARTSAQTVDHEPQPSPDDSSAKGAENSRSPDVGTLPSIDELLAMSKESREARLRSLPRAALEQINSWLQSQDVDTEKTRGPVTEDNVEHGDSEDEAEPLLLALRDLSDVLDSDVCGDTKVDEGRPRCHQLRGVLKRSGGRYCAMVGIKSMAIRSHDVRDLEEAIGMHITLTQMRQLFLSKFGSGASFKEAFVEAVREGLAARPQDSAGEMRVSFVVIVSCQGKRFESPSTQNVETAGMFWEFVYNKRLHETEWPTLRQKMLSIVAEERAARLMAKRSERAAVRLQQAAQRQKRKALYKQVQTAIRQLDRVEQSRCKERWGFSKLPSGLVEATLFENNDMLRAELSVQSEPVFGPMRRSLNEAKQDLQRLSAVQKAQGDEAMLELAHQLDVDAMVRHYAQSMLLL